MRCSPLVVLVTAAVGCAPRPHGGAGGGASLLTVFDYNGAAGYGTRVRYDGRAVSIVATSDFKGEQDITVWTRLLSAAERAFLDERIEQLPLMSLKEEYRDPDIWDGLQMSFDVRQGRKRTRSIAVANEYVEELAVLSDGLNALLPYKHRIRYREWKDFKDKMDRESAEPPAE